MYAFGGDPLAIYYDIAYHVCYGSGTHLANMNYPYGELLFLTDAQGALTWLLNKLNFFIPSICENAVGIMNMTGVLLMILASLIMYHLLRAFGVSQTVSWLFSPLIVVMSPQIIRMGAHFGLGYPFIIPLTMLWFVRKTNVKKVEWRDALFMLVIIFFGFNNAYIGFICSALLILGGAIYGGLFQRSYQSLYPSLAGVLTLFIPYLYFRLNDPVQDRIKLQWGFFHYNAKLEGLFLSPDSILGGIIQQTFNKSFNIDFEAVMNVGIVTTLIIGLYLVSQLIKKSTLRQINFSNPFITLFLAGFTLFLYASAIIFMPFSRDFIEEKMGLLLMFKASARIAWPMYFICTSAAIIILDHWKDRFKKIPVFYLLIIPAFIWLYEIKIYVLPKFRNINNENFFSKVKEDEILDFLNSSGINAENYQAILCVPKMMMWNDNFISQTDFDTQFYGIRISKATGMPMLSSMLSRISTGQIAEGIELLSSPYIYKSLVDKLPDKRPILIVSGKSHPALQEGEKFLLSIADTLVDHERLTLYFLPLDRINQNKYINSVCTLHLNQSVDSIGIIHLGFDNRESKLSYFSKGSLILNKGEHELLNVKIDSAHSENYVFSVWTYVDHESYGIGNFILQVMNEKKEIVFESRPDTRYSNDVHDNWIRTEIKFPVRNDENVRVQFNTNRAISIDEIILRPESKDYHLIEGMWILFNGYKVYCEE
jgi:hypothetical protein